MATLHLLTGTLVDLGLSPLADRTPYVVVKTNMPGGHPVMDSTGHVVLPTTRVAVNEAGEWAVSLIDTSATDLNIEPDTLQYTLIAEGTPEGMRQSGTVKVGPFPHTSAQRIDQVDADSPAISPTWRHAFRGEMEGLRNQAQSAASHAATFAAAGVADQIAADRTAVATDRAYVENLVITDLGTTDGQTSALIESPSSQTSAALNAAFEGRVTVSANKYGAHPSATWETNRDAFQAANDEVAAAGGGRVTAAPGTYAAVGIIQDSHVHFYLPDVTLSHPDGSTGDIITSRLTTQNAVIASGNLSAVYVTDSSAFEVGQIIGVRYAGPVNPTQNTTLTGAINSAQTTGITLAGTTGFPASGVMLVGSELVAYTGISGATLTGVTRGAFGTTATAHSAGAIIGQCLAHYSTISQIASPTTVLIADAATRPVTGSTILAGRVSPKVTGVSLHVNRVVEGGIWSYGLSWKMVRWGKIDDVYVQDGDGGVILDQGSSDCTIRDLALHNCGMPEVSGGSAFWLFRACKRNKINGLTVSGSGWVAAYLDDRTTTGTEWDGGTDDNILTDLRIDLAQPGTGTPAVYIVGGSRNYIAGGHIRAAGGGVVGVGLAVSQGAQGITHDGTKAAATANEFASFRLTGCRVPWNLSAPGNWLHDVTHEGAIGNPLNAGGNMTYAVKPLTSSPGVDLGVSFPDGTQSNPSIRLASDLNSGFWKYSDDAWALSMGAVRVMTFFTNQVRLGDGIHLDTGQTTGTKIGYNSNRKLSFWDATPVVQPANIPDTSGATLTELEAEVNKLKALLRTLGLTAAS